MSYFINALNAILAHHDATELAGASGLSSSSFSNYRKGRRVPEVDTLDLIVNAVPLISDRWSLTRGYILDHTPKTFLAQVLASLDALKYSDTLNEDKAHYLPDKDLDAALEALRHLAVGYPDVRQLLITLSRRL